MNKVSTLLAVSFCFIASLTPLKAVLPEELGGDNAEVQRLDLERLSNSRASSAGPGSGRTTLAGDTPDRRSVRGLTTFSDDDANTERGISLEEQQAINELREAAAQEIKAALEHYENNLKNHWSYNEKDHDTLIDAAVNLKSELDKSNLLYDQNKVTVALKELQTLLNRNEIFSKSRQSSPEITACELSKAISTLEACQGIKRQARKYFLELPERNHYDFCTLLKFPVTLLADVPTFPEALALKATYYMPIHTTLQGGFAANIAGLVASVFLCRHFLATLPDALRKPIIRLGERFPTDYFFYYMAGWGWLKIMSENTLAARSGWQAACLVPSALVRGAAISCMDRYRTQNKFKQGSPFESAMRDGLRRAFPEIVGGALVRSFLLNSSTYFKGTKFATEVLPETFFKAAVPMDPIMVIPKALFSTGVYTGALVSFYALYRVLELGHRHLQCYQKPAVIDIDKIKDLGNVLRGHHSYTYQDNLVDVNLIQGHQKEALLTKANELLDYSNMEKLSDQLGGPLGVLASQVASLCGDPFYRFFSPEFKVAYHALDEIKHLRAVNSVLLTSSNPAERQEGYQKFLEIKKFLTEPINIGGVQTSEMDEINQIQASNRIDALIKLFETFSKPPLSSKVPRQPLATSRFGNNYNSINSEENGTGL